MRKKVLSAVVAMGLALPAWGNTEAPQESRAISTQIATAVDKAVTIAGYVELPIFLFLRHMGWARQKWTDPAGKVMSLPFAIGIMAVRQLTRKGINELVYDGKDNSLVGGCLGNGLGNYIKSGGSWAATARGCQNGMFYEGLSKQMGNQTVPMSFATNMGIEAVDGFVAAALEGSGWFDALYIGGAVGAVAAGAINYLLPLASNPLLGAATMGALTLGYFRLLQR